jgi:hypothetical protein
MSSKVRSGYSLSAARLAEIRSAAESLLLAHEKSGGAAVADALIKESETLSYNVRAQFAIDLSKACISRGQTSLFESMLDALLSQAPPCAADAIDDLNFALDEAEDDDTFVDVKTSNRSNMHFRHTHHHLGLTIACFSSTAKQRYLLALQDPNTLMYPKIASLLCSFHRSSPVTPDSELIALVSDPNAVPLRTRVVMSACIAHERTAVCDALASYFWTNHHCDRSALLLPSCSLSFLHKFLANCPDVMAQREFNALRFVRLQPEVSLHLFEEKLKVSPPSLRPSTWIHGPFQRPFMRVDEWFEPLLRHTPAAHLRIAALARSYPACRFSTLSDFTQSGPRVSITYDNKPVNALHVVLPVFPLCMVLKRCLPEHCKVKGKSVNFWSVWFPLLMDSVAMKSQPVLKELNVASAFDSEEGREAARCALLALLPPEDQQNELLVACILRSHTIAEVESFRNIDTQKFNAMVAFARDACHHPAMSRAFYHDHKSIFDLPLTQEQYCLLLEKILSVAVETESHSSLHSIDLISNLKLDEAFANVVSCGARDLLGPSRPLSVFIALHRLKIACLCCNC